MVEEIRYISIVIQLNFTQCVCVCVWGGITRYQSFPPFLSGVRRPAASWTQCNWDHVSLLGHAQLQWVVIRTKRGEIRTKGWSLCTKLRGREIHTDAARYALCPLCRILISKGILNISRMKFYLRASVACVWWK